MEGGVDRQFGVEGADGAFRFGCGFNNGHCFSFPFGILLVKNRNDDGAGKFIAQN
ncbi:hypothetical protein D3C86_1120790 [compost metagenome]